MATKPPVPATHNRDTPGVIAPPPFIYLAALGIGVGIDAILPSVSLPAGVRWSVGTLAVLLGLWLMRSFIQAFRRADTAVNPFRPTSAIVADGPYKFTRNPGYLGMALVCGGAAVLFDAIWALPVVAGAMVVIDRGVIAREERYLDAKFGAEYREYRSQVRRWV